MLRDPKEAGNAFNLTHLGCTIPPNVDSYWVGDAGPGPSYIAAHGDRHRYTNRTALYMAHNLVWMAGVLAENPCPTNLRELDTRGIALSDDWPVAPGLRADAGALRATNARTTRPVSPAQPLVRFRSRRSRQLHRKRDCLDRRMEPAMPLTAEELQEIDRANESGRQPIMFVHGLWLLPSSWDRWRELFEQHGYSTLAPGWPDDPDTAKEARDHPEVFAKKSLKVITAHYAEAIRALKIKPALVGHSFGGVIAEELAGEGLSAVTVAIDPAPFRGVLPLPVSALKSAAPILVNPANYGRAVSLTFEQFQFGWANALPEREANELYEMYHVPGAGRPLFSAAFANVNPWTEDRVDTTNPDRGPMLLIAGEDDNTVPWAIVSAAWQRQLRNPAVTDIKTFPGRGHSLVIDHGWKDVAECTLAYIKAGVAAEVGSTK